MQFDSNLRYMLLSSLLLVSFAVWQFNLQNFSCKVIVPKLAWLNYYITAIYICQIILEFNMTTDCIFCKILSGKVESKILYQNDSCFVIRDIAPNAPLHLLIIPNKHITYFEPMVCTFQSTQHDDILSC